MIPGRLARLLAAPIPSSRRQPARPAEPSRSAVPLHDGIIMLD